MSPRWGLYHNLVLESGPEFPVAVHILIYYHEGVEPYYPLTEEIFNDIIDANIRGSLSAISIAEFVTKPLADGPVIVVEYFKQFPNRTINSSLGG